jgi:GcrA cell cycle regulator
MTSPNDLPWTEERESKLKELWIQGISGSKIAAELGCRSTGSVTGKARRLGLSKRKEGSHGSFVPPPSAKPEATPPRQVTAVPPRSAFNPGPPKGRRPDHVFGHSNTIQTWNPPPLTDDQKDEILGVDRCCILDLTVATCRWPIGDARDTRLELADVRELKMAGYTLKFPVNPDADRAFRFCGAKTFEGEAYCPHHCGRAYTERPDSVIHRKLRQLRKART